MAAWINPVIPILYSSNTYSMQPAYIAINLSVCLRVYALTQIIYVAYKYDNTVSVSWNESCMKYDVKKPNYLH